MAAGGGSASPSDWAAQLNLLLDQVGAANSEVQPARVDEALRRASHTACALLLSMTQSATSLIEATDGNPGAREAFLTDLRALRGSNPLLEVAAKLLLSDHPPRAKLDESVKQGVAAILNSPESGMSQLSASDAFARLREDLCAMERTQEARVKNWGAVKAQEREKKFIRLAGASIGTLGTAMALTLAFPALAGGAIVGGLVVTGGLVAELAADVIRGG